MGRLTKKQLDQLKSTFIEIKPLAEKKLAEFERIGRESDNKGLFIELAFCLLTPQSGARRCWTAVENLIEKNLLFSAPAHKIADELNIVRFKNNKSRYIVEARNRYINGQDSLRSFMSADIPVREKRKILVENVKGYGLKEASHFLRNTGFGSEVAILDRHILRSMEKFTLIPEIPVSISEKKYLELEDILSSFSNRAGIPLKYMDFVLWYSETGDIFK